MTAIHGTRDVGSRYATRVRVSTRHGSCFDGLTGTVVRTYGGLVYVRLRDRGEEVTLPFSRGELEVLG